MIEPPMPSQGGSLLNWCLTAWRYMRACRPKAGPGIQLTETSSGTIISLVTKPGGGGQAALGALVVTSSRPAFIAAPTGAGPADGTLRVWVTYGTINSRVATNLTDYFDITTEKAIYAKATFTTSGGFAITSWEIEVQALNWEIPAPSGPRPSTGYYALGAVHQVGDNLILANNGSGSLTVWPQISNSLSGTTADTTIVWRR